MLLVPHLHSKSILISAQAEATARLLRVMATGRRPALTTAAIETAEDAGIIDLADTGHLTAANLAGRCKTVCASRIADTSGSIAAEQRRNSS